MIISTATNGIIDAIVAIFVVTNGSTTAINGTVSAKVVHFESDTTKQPAALPSHFLFQKDARELRAREVSLDSLPCRPPKRSA
ncbi:hypothetical protein [Vibrio agarivorans]|uniref:Uncharacterized protein n=1 Tax=Vibrio agarivorans TaxID=153622 RepID=A0ABT7Y0W6_9VIBR|nr:hypothetical protein [Vibrio agarivorans]MDN2481671.1 hypothetical protein [Vibrio agarivorans]